MKARWGALVMAVAVAGYLVLAAGRGVAALATGTPAGIGLGLAILAFPLVGAWLVWRELQFGRETQRLADRLAAADALPVDDLPRRPSGRADRGAAAERFAAYAADVERRPQDWATWFRLGIAYDDAGDRRRAREAVRRAIALERLADAEGPQGGGNTGGHGDHDEERRP